MTWLEMLGKALDEAEKGGFSIDREKLQIGEALDNNNYYGLIFRHDFLQAIFGNGDQYEEMYESAKRTAKENGIEFDESFLPLPLWKKMAQQMVLSTSPLEWLSGAIDNKEKFDTLGTGTVEGTKDTSAIRDRIKQMYNSGKSFK